jgi:hypothetical protein
MKNKEKQTKMLNKIKKNPIKAILSIIGLYLIYKYIKNEILN